MCFYILSQFCDVWSQIKIGSVRWLDIPVLPSVPKMEYNMPLGAIFFSRGCTFVGIYVCYVHHSHARLSYHRWFRSLLLCPSFVKYCYFPFFVDSDCGMYSGEIISGFYNQAKPIPLVCLGHWVRSFFCDNQRCRHSLTHTNFCIHARTSTS